MKVNIYYGGRGLLDDPTLYVLNKMEEVLQELRVTVERINIYRNASANDERCGWYYSCDHHRVAWDRRLHAAVPGCLLAVWR